MTVSEYKHKFLYTSSEKMSELPITNGQFIFCHDKGTLYFDFDDVRKQYGEVTVVSNDTERLAETPLDKSFYYVEDRKSLWFYRNETWIQISQDWANIVTTLQNKTVGMIEYEPRADITTVEQFIALDSGNYYLTKFSGMMYDVNEEFLMTLYANSRIQIEKGTDSTNIHLITNDGEVIFYHVTTFEQVNGDITFTMLKCESYEYNDFAHVNERIDEVLSKSKMVVTISPAQTLAVNPVNDWVADKTFAEIKEFIDNGGNPILYFDDGNENILNLSTTIPNAIIFSAMLINTSTAVTPLSDITMPNFIELRVEINRQDAVSVRINQVAVADIVIDKLSTIDKTVAGAINEINGRVVQSNYEQQDSTQIDYIKNRPFHDSILETNYVEGDTINIDTDNMYNLVMSSGVVPYCLVSSTTPTMEDVNKGWSVTVDSGITQTGTECQQVSENLLNFNSVFIVLADNTEFSGIVFPKKGIYTIYGITSITITGFEGFDVYNVIEPIKTLDKKFLPEDYATMGYVNDTFTSKGSFLTSLSTLTYRNHFYTINMSDGSRIFAWILTEKGLWGITSSTIFDTGYKRLRINTADYTIESLNRQSDQDVPTFNAKLYDINTGRIINSQSVSNVTKVEIGKFSKISGNNFYIYIDDSFQYVMPTHSFDEIQSDWNQNDENVSDYVKNRPFYTTDPVENVIYDATIVKENLELNGPHYLYHVSDILKIVKDCDYIITLNGEVFNLIAKSFKNVPFIGNGHLFDTEIEDTGESFCIVAWAFITNCADEESLLDSYELKIVGMFPEIIQIDEKYISYKPGLKVAGRTFSIDGIDTVASDGAEIFNNYEGNKATGDFSHAEGSTTTASGFGAHAEGSTTTASGFGAHAEGNYTAASGICAHAEGQYAIATSQCAHAEGIFGKAVIRLTGEANTRNYTVNTDIDSIYKELFLNAGYISRKNVATPATKVEKVIISNGKITGLTLNGTISNTTLNDEEVVFTYGSIAFGKGSHAEGVNTFAYSEYQHTQGRYNLIDDKNKYAHIVGNGSDPLNRSNAHTVDWDGNAEYAGDVVANGCGGEAPISLVETAQKANAGQDYNQNDENASDYVKNRTHYVKDPEAFALTDEQTIEFNHVNTLAESSTEPNPSAFNYVVSPYIPFSDESKQIELINVQKCTVSWDGIEYPDITVVQYDDGFFSIGANRTIDENNEFNGYDFSVYPFVFEWVDNIACSLCIGTSEFDADTTSVSHTFKITGYFSDVVQLPEKYISYKPGLKVEGQIYNGEKAEYGAEIFNDYEQNIAIGKYSHAEGFSSKASGRSSHSEGDVTVASGFASHAEGTGTTASGYNSHAEGTDTIASGRAQHVQGRYNIEDTKNTYAHIVGNGDVTKRSNAHTLDWKGNAEYAGDVKANAYTSTPISLVNISTLISALIGDDSDKTIRTIANEVLAEQLIEENADESLNSIKELAAWFQQHPKEAASMNAAIQALQNLVGTLPEGVVSTTIVDYIKESIDANNSAMTFKLDEEGVLYI